MIEITTIMEFEKLPLRSQCDWLESQLKINIIIVPNETRANGRAKEWIASIDQASEKAIKHAMIEKGWNYTQGYMEGAYSMSFWKKLQDRLDIRRAYITDKTEAEAVIYAAAKALLMENNHEI